jgi:hypothetical protein
MNSFKENGYEVVRGAIGSDLASFLSEELKILKEITAIENGYDPSIKAFNDEKTPYSFAWYSPIFAEVLSKTLLPKVEKIVGKKLYQSFSFARIYYENSELFRHTDRKGCEYALSICLEKDPSNWLIGFKGYDGVDTLIDADVGDMIVYLGSEVEHWRDKFKGNQQIQAFLFYVNQDGEYSHLKYDTRPWLGMGEQHKTNK